VNITLRNYNSSLLSLRNKRSMISTKTNSWPKYGTVRWNRLKQANVREIPALREPKGKAI